MVLCVGLGELVVWVPSFGGFVAIDAVFLFGELESVFYASLSGRSVNFNFLCKVSFFCSYIIVEKKCMKISAPKLVH